MLLPGLERFCLFVVLTPRGSRVVACGALEPTALTLLQRLLQHLAQWIGSHSTSLGFSSQGLQRGDSPLFQHGSIIHMNCKPPKRSLHACLLSCSAVGVQLFATPWTIACQAPLSMGFSRQEHWSGLPCPPPGNLANPGTKQGSPVLHADSLPAELPGKPHKGYIKS